jgi:hypothetical protein
MKKSIIALTALLLLASCKDEPKFKILPTGPIKHQLIVMAKTSRGVRARGFRGATPPNTPVFVEVGSHNNKKENTISDAEGRFDVELTLQESASVGDLTFSVDSKHYSETYQIKNLPEAIANVAKKPFSTDNELSYVALNGSSAAILSSNAMLISLHNVDETGRLKKKASSTIGLNPNATANLFPRMVASKGNHALVPFSGSGELALLNLSQGSIADKSRLKDKTGNLYLFENNPALTVKIPLSVDGTSESSTSISKSFAHSPEQIIALDDTTYLASFANYYQFADHTKNDLAVVGKGIVALLKIENNKIRSEAIVELPFKNPRYFMVKNETEIWVSCAGAYRDTNTNPITSDDAGLVKLTLSADKTSLSLSNPIALVDFSPGQPALVGSKLVVPLAYGNKIAVLEENATAFTDNDIKPHPFHRPFSFTLASLWHDDLVFLASSDGSLVVYSLNEGYFPFPFIEPLMLNGDQDKRLMPSPEQLIFRFKDYAKDYQPGFGAWAVIGGQEKIVPLDLLEIFGP